MPRKMRRGFRVMGQVPTPEAETQVPAVTPETPAPVEPVVETPAPVVPDPAVEPTSFDATYVKGLRTENANARIRNKELQDRIDALEREKLSEVDALKLDVTKFKDDVVPSLTRENQNLKVQLEAVRIGIVDPDAAALLLDWNAINSGTPVNEALLALVEQRPWLKKQDGTPTAPVPPATPPAPQTPTTPSVSNPANPPAPGAKQYTKSEIDKMNPNRISQTELDDILLALKEGRVDMSR